MDQQTSQSDSTNHSTNQPASYVLEKDAELDIGYNSNYSIDFSKKFKHVAESYRLSPLHFTSNYDLELKHLYDFLLPKLQSLMEEKKSLKFHVTLLCMFYKENSDPIKFAEMHLDAKSRLCLESDQLEVILHSLMNEFRERIETKLQLASNFIFEKLIHADVIFLDYRPVRGLNFVQLPEYLKKFHQCLTNIQNRDSLCIVYCVLAKMFPCQGSNKHRPSKYLDKWARIDSSGLQVTNKLRSKSEFMSDAKILERDNQFLSINIFIPDEDNKSILPYKLSDRSKYTFDELGNCTVNDDLIEIDLLLISQNDNYHFVSISKFSTLIQRLNSRSNEVRVACRRCLWTFQDEAHLRDHMECCLQQDAQVCRMPKPGSVYKFTAVHKSLPKSFTLYYDFECYQKKVQGCAKKPLDPDFIPPYPWMKFEYQLKHAQFCQLCTSTSPCTTVQPTEKTSIQSPYAYGLYVACIRPDLYSFPVHIDCCDAESGLLSNFLNVCREYCIKLYPIINTNKPVLLSEADLAKIKNTKNCKYCTATTENSVFNIDHDHLTVNK